MNRNPRLLNLQIIEVRETKGEGITEDPIRRIRCWYTVEGELIATQDPCAPSENFMRMEAIDNPKI